MVSTLQPCLWRSVLHIPACGVVDLGRLNTYWTVAVDSDRCVVLHHAMAMQASGWKCVGYSEATDTSVFIGMVWVVLFVVMIMFLYIGDWTDDVTVVSNCVLV